MIQIERRNIFWIWLLIILVNLPVYSQTEDPSVPKIEVGAAYGAIGPIGDLRDNVGSWSFKNKGLLNFDLILPLHTSGIPRLRLDYFFGHYHKDTLSNHTYGIRGFSLGPEVGLPGGPIRPYANAGFEWISFFAGSYLLDEEKQRISESVDGGSGWFFGGGSRIPVDSAGRWAIDIGLRCHHGGNASYLAEGGIQINPDESLTIIPTRGKMPFLIFTLGFQFKP